MTSDSPENFTQQILDRSELLLGADAMARLARTRVILFGTGGVGSWAAEALVRTGVGHLTMVDSDTVAPSNINRQLPATTATIGQSKVHAMAERLATVNPAAEIVALQKRYTAETADDFRLEEYDYVIDAIDSVADKALLILRATSAPGVTLLSSMGAARKVDPSRIRVAEFRQATGCPLAAALRRRFKHTGLYPRRKFKAVYSDEVRQNARPSADGANGSLVHITAIWGLTLASLVINSVAAAKTQK